MSNGELTVYKDSRSRIIDPSDYQAWSAKGWGRDKPASTYEKLTSPYDPGAAAFGEKHKTLGPLVRFLSSAGGAAMGLPGSLYHSMDAPTEEEKKKYGSNAFEMGKGALPRAALGFERLSGASSAPEAREFYSGKSNIKPTMENIKSIAPEALGVGTGTMASAQLMAETLGSVKELGDPKTWDQQTLKDVHSIAKPIVDKVSKILKGKHGEVLGEMEDFRKTMKAKPTPRQRDVANIKHRALQERINKEWNDLYGGLKGEPTDALAIKRALQKLAEVDPIVKKWVADNIKESETGASVSVPLWPKVRELSAQLNKDMANPRLDRVHKAEIPEAHKALESLLKESAKRQGMDKQYARAYSLNRKLENIKYHTAYGAQPVKPSQLYALGGAVTGIAASSGMGISGELGSAFIGKMIGEYVGKAITKAGGKYTIPERSISAEKAVWKSLGEKPPKGIEKKIVKPTEPDK